MGIGSLGLSEMLVIFLIVLVLFGPRRFPEIARSMGHAMREFRRSLNQIQRELEEADPRTVLPRRKPGSASDSEQPARRESESSAEGAAGPPAKPARPAPDSGADDPDQIPMFGSRPGSADPPPSPGPGPTIPGSEAG